MNFDLTHFFIVFHFLQDEAQKKYIDIVTELTAAQGTASSEPETAPGAMETLKVEVKDNLTVITFNRPNKKNAFSRQVRILASGHLALYVQYFLYQYCIVSD